MSTRMLSICLNMLRHQAGRQGPIWFWHANDACEAGVVMSCVDPFKSRLLEMNDACLLVEKPKPTLDRHVPEQGDLLSVLIAHSGSRYRFDSKVLARRLVEVNNQQQTIALELSLPTEAQLDQRRQFFRAAFAADDKAIPLVRLRPMNPQQAEIEQAMEVALADIGGGGIGVYVSEQQALQLMGKEFFDVLIHPPESEQAIHCTARLVHVELADHHKLQFGLVFEIDDHIEADRISEAATHFAAWQQRRTLKQQHQSLTS